jgi:hypothetical protein
VRRVAFRVPPGFSATLGGGDEGDRTPDLRLAKPALSQLSYIPGIIGTAFKVFWMVGPSRIELPTSRLSGVRSNQLSYGPTPFSKEPADSIPPAPGDHPPLER